MAIQKSSLIYLKMVLLHRFLYVYQAGQSPLYPQTKSLEFPLIEGSLEVKLPTIWRDEKQSREEAERRERLEERRVEEKE